MGKLKLHDYQEVARDHLQRNPRAGLFLDMGLGKTAITLMALRPEQLPALVVAPKRVAESVWPTEAKLWRPDLSVALALGQPAARARGLAADRDIVVVSRDNLKDAIKAKRERPFKTLVIDELSGFKSRKSIRWRSARAVIRRMGADPYVWGLAGTPAPNGLLDLWGQLALLDGGQRLGKTLGEYRAKHFTPGRRLPSGVIIEWNLIPGHDEKIHRKIDDICLSMATDGRIELPPTTYNEIEVDLTPTARKIYKAMKKDLVADLDMIGGEIHSAANGAALSNKLSQIAAGFMYADDPFLDRAGEYTVIHREKVKAVQEVVEGTGSPVLVFYRYKAELELLKEALGAEAHTIDEPDVIDQWNAGNIPVLLAHPASAGHGLNLQHGGHTIVWSTLPWSLEEWQQANKRLARQGQKHPVVIHLIMARKTVDYVIQGALEGKDDVQTALLDHLESPL